MGTVDLDRVGPAAADIIRQRGWIQGAMESPDGVCLSGALKACDLQPGDWYIAQAVAQRQGRGVGWNDAPDRSQDEVVEFLMQFKVLDADLEDTFGPMWEDVIAIVRHTASMTTDQAKRLAAARVAAMDAARVAAGDAAWYAARDAARYVARDAARDAGWYAGGDAARDAAWGAATHDLIGTNGYTQEHYDLLMGPWRQVFGD